MLVLLPDTLMASVSQCIGVFQKIRSWRQIKRNVESGNYEKDFMLCVVSSKHHNFWKND
jgi:hypothetical protein